MRLRLIIQLTVHFYYRGFNATCPATLSQVIKAYKALYEKVYLCHRNQSDSP